MKRVILAGELGKRFGKERFLAVNTPAEALRAIDCLKPGFIQYLLDSDKDGVTYKVLLNNKSISAPSLTYPFSDKEVLVLAPSFRGASASSDANWRAGGKILVGALMIAAAVYTGGTSTAALGPSGTFATGMASTSALGISYGTIAMMGAALALSGVSMFLAPQLTENTENPSHIFNGPENTIRQGGPVPIGYGEMMVGSTVISAGISTLRSISYDVTWTTT